MIPRAGFTNWRPLSMLAFTVLLVAVTLVVAWQPGFIIYADAADISGRLPPAADLYWHGHPIGRVLSFNARQRTYRILIRPAYRGRIPQASLLVFDTTAQAADPNDDIRSERRREPVLTLRVIEPASTSLKPADRLSIREKSIDDASRNYVKALLALRQYLRQPLYARKARALRTWRLGLEALLETYTHEIATGPHIQAHLVPSELSFYQEVCTRAATLKAGLSGRLTLRTRKDLTLLLDRLGCPQDPGPATS